MLGPLVLGQATNLVYEGWVSGRMEGGRSQAEVVADLRAAVAFVDRTERRARLNGLQLLRIADQHDFRARFGGV